MIVNLTWDMPILWFVAYSMIGWVYESVLVSVKERRWVNRGFLNGPVCPIYGVGAVLAMLLLGSLRNLWVVFVASALGASVLEYITSWVMELMFHARWWDYSHFRFNIQGRVCALGALIFGLGGVAITAVEPWVVGLTLSIPASVRASAALVLLAILAVDTAVTVLGMMHFDADVSALWRAVQAYAQRAEVSLQEGRDGAEERIQSWVLSSQQAKARLRAAARTALNNQQRRMIASFPRMQMKGRERVMTMLREALRRKP